MSDYSRLILGEEDSQTAPVCNGTVREMIAEIDRLKVKLEEERSSWSLKAIEQFNRADDLERQLAEAEYQIEKQTIETRAATQLASDYIKQLAEARAEVDRLKVIKWVQTESYEAVAAVQQARQEAARTIERHLLGMFWCIPSKENEPMIYRDQAIEWLRGCFKLEG